MPKRLYKFAKAEFALLALERRRLKISTIDDVNDPFDLYSVDTTDPGVEAFLQQHIIGFRATSGLLCFSRNWDNLLLWSHYADSHAGICLGFDIPDASAIEMEVHYQPNVIQISGPEEIGVHFMDRVLRTKHESWSYEQESRMFVRINDPADEKGLHFIDFGDHLTLREVIFGVHCLPEYYEPAVSLLKDHSETTHSWAYMRKDSFLLARRIAPTSGRPYTATSPFGGVTTAGYSSTGTIPMAQTRTGPDGFTRTTLDGVGRVIRMERGTSSSSIQTVVDTVYAPCACSPLGKMKKVSRPYAPGASTIYWTTYTYDAIGRTVSIQQPDAASTSTYSYAGNQTTATDPAGKWKTFTNDVLGNMVTVLEPNPAGGTFTTSYTYDYLHHVTQVSMTRGSTTQARTFTYDNQGRLTSSTNPENGAVAYYYNADNTLWYSHDAKGQDTVYTYDTAKRPTMVQRYPTGKSNAEDTCARATNYWNTNPYSGTFSLNTVNRLAAVAYGSWGTPSGCLTGENQHAWYEMYSYHATGAVTAKRLTVNGGGAVTANYTYTSSGRMLTTSYPMAISGSTVTDTFTYGYDGMARPVSLTGSESPSPLTWVQNVQYDFASRISSMQYRVSPTSSNFTTEAMGFNSNGQLTSMGWSGTGSPVTGSLTYSYSGTQNNGQITQVVDTISGETISYQYDSLKRLTSATSTAPWTETFQYDGFGNLTAKVLNGTTISIPADPATNRLTSASYDLNGNMASGVGATFAFDVANRILTAAAVSGGTEYYGYAPNNKRIYKKLTSGAEEYTFYGANGQKLGIYNLTTTTVTALRTNVWFGGKLISENGAAVFEDRLGTNRASGARFYPYGDEITSTANDRQKFATYTRDGYTGLDYADQRYFASAYGRFNTTDPHQSSAGAASPDGWNRYSYTRGDPANRRDPKGLSDEYPDYCEIYTSDPHCDPFYNPFYEDQKVPGPNDPSPIKGITNGELTIVSSHLDEGVGEALKVLHDNPDCAALFGRTEGSPDAFSFLLSLQRGNSSYGWFGIDRIGQTSPTLITNAQTIPMFGHETNSSGQLVNTGVNGVMITINANNTPFNSSSYTAQDRAVTILHELGHAYEYLFGADSTRIRNDQDDPEISMSNTARIKETCYFK